MAWLCLAGVLLFFASLDGMAQDPATGGADGQGGDTGEKSRDERLQRYNDRVRQLLEERRKAMEEKERLRQEAIARGETPEPLFRPPAPPTLPTTPRVLVATPPAPAPGPASPPAAGPPPAGPASIPVNAQPFLLFEPMNVSAGVGEVFDIRAALQNDRYVPFDEIEMLLSYPESVMELIEVSDAPLRSALQGQPRYENSPASGTLHYHAWLGAFRPSSRTPLLDLRWRARAPVVNATLQFVLAPGAAQTTALRFKGVDRLGLPENAGDGALAACVSIERAAGHPGAPGLQRMAAPARSAIRLRLSAGTPRAIVDEEFVATVSVENPGGQPMDLARARLWFNPAVLQVQDWDQGNRIRRGINVNDGSARERFPFSILNVNSADNLLGEIQYEMGAGERFVPPSGDLFQIKFRAVAPAAENLIAFDILPASSGPATAILCDGANVTDYHGMLTGDEVFLNVPVAAGATASAFTNH